MPCNIRQPGRSVTILLLLATVCCTGKQTGNITLPPGAARNLFQVKTNSRCSMLLQVMAGETAKASITGAAFLRAKLVIRSNTKIRNNTLMHYLNFGIQNSIRAVLGTDSSACIACERIPGINENEFTYLLAFSSTAPQNNLGPFSKLVIRDTVAGFGTTVFDIKR